MVLDQPSLWAAILPNVLYTFKLPETIGHCRPVIAGNLAVSGLTVPEAFQVVEGPLLAWLGVSLLSLLNRFDISVLRRALAVHRCARLTVSSCRCSLCARLSRCVLRLLFCTYSALHQTPLKPCFLPSSTLNCLLAERVVAGTCPPPPSLGLPMSHESA
jgi:hypothetical protein